MRITIGRSKSESFERPDSLPPRSSPETTAAELPGDDDYIDIGGLRIQGIKLESINGAHAKLEVQLKRGNYLFPGPFHNAETTVPKNCSATVELRIAKGTEGKLKITLLQLRLSKPIVIENPVTAFLKKKEGFWATATSTLGDHLAKVHVEGLTIDENGAIALEGTLVKGGLFNSSLSDFCRAEGGDADEDEDSLLGAIDLDLRHLAETLKPNDNDRAVGFEVLKSIGQMAGEAHYALDLDVSPTVISAHSESIDLLTQKCGAKAHVEGKLSLNSELDFAMTADQNCSFIDSLLGKMIIGGALRIEHPLAELAHVDFQILSHMTHLPKVDVNGHEIAAKKLEIAAAGAVDISPANFSAVNGDGQLYCEVKNPRMKVEKTTMSLNGSLGMHLGLREFQFQDINAAPAFRAKLRGYVKEEPKQGSHELKGLEAEIDFRLHRNGRVSVSPAHNPTSFIFPLPFENSFSQIESETLLDSPLARKTKSEFLSRIEKIANSRIRSGNRVELLVDGIQSYPRRLQLIQGAQESIWLQTLIFCDDVSGMVTAGALCDAARRGVKVHVIVDGQGSANDLTIAMAENQAYKMMVDAGVELRIHNDAAITGLRDIIDVLIDNKLTSYSKDALLTGPVTRLVALICDAVIQLQKGTLSLRADQKSKLVAGINKGLGRDEKTPVDVTHPIFSLDSQGSIQLTDLLKRVKEIVKHVYSWHEKHFIVDGQRAILGGMNISDPYMFGGRLFRTREGKISEGWRDTDLLIDGPAVDDAAAAFSKNWNHLTGTYPVAPKYKKDSIDRLPGKDVKVQVIQHSPSIDGDNHITSFIVAHLDRLQKGGSAIFENAYFCASSSLSSLFDAMIRAAKRGVNVVVLTNSKTTSDLPTINSAAFHTYRDLLKAGVRIFERRDTRTMHSKIAVLGDELAIVGSANLDNRSARINSEVIAAVYDEDFANTQRKVIETDLDERVAKEITLHDLSLVSPIKSAHFAAMSLIQDLC